MNPIKSKDFTDLAVRNGKGRICDNHIGWLKGTPVYDITYNGKEMWLIKNN